MSPPIGAIGVELPNDDDDHMPTHSPTGPRPDFVPDMPRLLFFTHEASMLQGTKP
jgi:hypothetical protein